MPINWGDTTSADVKGYLDANPPPAGFDWGDFWNKVLWFGVPPDQVAHNIDQGFGDLADRMKSAGVPTSSDIWDGMVRADRNLEGAFADAVAAPQNAANATLTAIAPYLAVAGLVWVAVEVRRAR